MCELACADTPLCRHHLQLFPILQKVGSTFATQTRIVEKLTRLFKHAVHATKDHFFPLIGPVVSWRTHVRRGLNRRCRALPSRHVLGRVCGSLG